MAPILLELVTQPQAPLPILTPAKLIIRMRVSDHFCDVYDHPLFMKIFFFFF